MKSLAESILDANILDPSTIFKGLVSDFIDPDFKITYNKKKNEVTIGQPGQRWDILSLATQSSRKFFDVLASVNVKACGFYLESDKPMIGGETCPPRLTFDHDLVWDLKNPKMENVTLRANDGPSVIRFTSKKFPEFKNCKIECHPTKKLNISFDTDCAKICNIKGIDFVWNPNIITFDMGEWSEKEFMKIIKMSSTDGLRRGVRPKYDHMFYDCNIEPTKLFGINCNPYEIIIQTYIDHNPHQIVFTNDIEKSKWDEANRIRRASYWFTEEYVESGKMISELPVTKDGYTVFFF